MVVGMMVGVIVSVGVSVSVGVFVGVGMDAGVQAAKMIDNSKMTVRWRFIGFSSARNDKANYS